MSKTFAACAADLLREHGPLDLDRLHALAVEQGATKARTSTSLRHSLYGPRFVQRPDGRYDTAARLLTGQVFTTRLRRPPADGVLWSVRDLEPLAALWSYGAVPLSSGGAVRRGAGDVPTWTGPPGWLPPSEPGGLLALRWDGTALCVDVPVGVSPADSDRAQDVRRVLARHAAPRGLRHLPTEDLATTVVSALVEDPDLFARALPPLSELMPLPTALRPHDAWPSHQGGGGTIVLPVPLATRVNLELGRRADLLGEQLPEYISMLLSAAADRVAPPPVPKVSYGSYEDGSLLYEHDAADVIDLRRWNR